MLPPTKNRRIFPLVGGGILSPPTKIFKRKNPVGGGQNNSYEITINGFQVRKNKGNKKRNFRSPLWETFLSVKAEVGMFTKLSTWWDPNILWKNLAYITKIRDLKLITKKIRKQSKNSFLLIIRPEIMLLWNFSKVDFRKKSWKKNINYLVWLGDQSRSTTSWLG